MLRRSILALVSVLALALPASALELTMSQDTFEPQEDIEVLAYNETTKLVSFPSSAPYVARNLETGEVVGFIGLTVIIPLAPGERTSFMIMGGQLAPGRWALDVQYWEDGELSCCDSVEFTISATGGTPTDTSSVGQLKDQYRD